MDFAKGYIFYSLASALYWESENVINIMAQKPRFRFGAFLSLMFSSACTVPIVPIHVATLIYSSTLL